MITGVTGASSGTGWVRPPRPETRATAYPAMNLLQRALIEVAVHHGGFAFVMPSPEIEHVLLVPLGTAQR